MEISKYFPRDNIIVLEIKGEVDAYTSQELNKTLINVLSDRHSQIVVDVSQMIFISSAGIRALLYAHREAVEFGGELRLVGPTDHVQRIFEVAGFFELLRITDSLEESINDW